jgi:intracellular sulfur oxidation DsrE/DsrF family protein
MFDVISKDPQALGNVIGALIGVAGLFVGTFITIFTSFIVRSMDIRREERKEDAALERAKKEKAFNLKQEIYSLFISELASLENFLTKKSANTALKNLENFDNEWTRIEIKVDLVASPAVQTLKDHLQEELMNLAKKRFSSKDSAQEITLTDSYMENRTALLQAIREDMEITPNPA